MGKRMFDIVASATLLVALAPLIAGIALAVRIGLGRPVLFCQERPGRHGKPFRMVKFRSMTDRRGPDGLLLADAQRMTRFGQFLRGSSLDELPELWNVLKGEMSFVGPRPLLMEYLPLYDERQMRRHEVRPGITGWAQVRGRNALTWDEKFAADVWYVDHRSFLLDLKILVLSVVAVVRRHGISAAGEATMRPFAGNRPQ